MQITVSYRLVSNKDKPWTEKQVVSRVALKMGLQRGLRPGADLGGAVVTLRHDVITGGYVRKSRPAGTVPSGGD